MGFPRSVWRWTTRAHFTVHEYLTSPKNVDVSAIVTCADASTSLKVVTISRVLTYFYHKYANKKMVQIDPFEVMKAEKCSGKIDECDV